MNITTFLFQGNIALRTVTKNGQPWFVARDVCEVLGIGNVGMAVSRLDDDERNTIILNDGTPGNPNTAIVNEPGLYSLILGSRKAEAKTFKRWITHEVIPSIRKTGTYSIPRELDERQLRTELFRAALEHEERIGTIEERIDEVERKVTLDYAEQELVRRSIARRVYEFATGDDRRELFSQLHREIKDRWAVATYKDVKRIELQQVIQYVQAWRPKVLV